MRPDHAIRRRFGSRRDSGPSTPFGPPEPAAAEGSIDLRRRRDQLAARVAELQCDLGGLVYEMAIRDRIRVDVIVQRAAVLQDADAELGEVERILRLEQTATAGPCASLRRAALAPAPRTAGSAGSRCCRRSRHDVAPPDAAAAYRLR